MKWELIRLDKLCRPKQWKTISIKDLKSNGYPVYGANGKIGFYDQYTHLHPTILITCRGATCGEINICEPKSYVNGNAMALDTLDPKVDLNYLKYYLKARGFKDVISGSAQPQITRTGLAKVLIPLPPLETQRKIAAILDKADELVQNDKKTLKKYNQLAQSVFLEMFGDPEKDTKGWGKINLGNVISYPNGLIDPRVVPYSNMYHVGGDNIISYTGELINLKKSNELNLISGKFLFSKENLLYNKIRPYLNKVAKPNFIGICSADMYPIKPNQERINRDFLIYILRSISFLDYADKQSRRANIPKINKSEIAGYKIIMPPIKLQNRFADIITHIETQKQLTRQSLQKSEALFQSLLQGVFRGDIIGKKGYEINRDGLSKAAEEDTQYSTK